jgi:sugar/nucleoside kinase (ribokinase family)
MRILVAGELNPDLVLSGYDAFPRPGKEILVNDAVMTLGSASAICAVGLARLGNEVAFTGKVGCDSWGDFCLNALAAEGIDVSRIRRDGAVKTGLTVSVTNAKDRALVTYMGAIGQLSAAEIDPESFAGFRHLHVSSYYLQNGLRVGLAGLFDAAQERGLTTSLDPGYDPREEWNGGIRDALRHTDVFFPNELELSGITDCADPATALRALAPSCPLIVAKLGAEGCLAMGSGELVSIPAFPVEPVDTTGAGDSFNAGFLHAWLRGATLREALRFASACGALSTLGAGGTTSQPAAQLVEQFLSRY